MKGGTWAVLAALGGAVAIGVYAATRRLDVKGKTVLHVGDSHVGGLAPHLAALLESKGAAYMADSDVGSSTSGYAASGRTLELARRLHPALVIVTLGTNDETPPRASVATIVAQAKRGAPGAKVVWWGPPRAPRRPDRFRVTEDVAGAEKIATAKAGAVFVDSFPWTSDATLYAPGRPPVEWIHLTREGYLRWAKGALQETL